MYAFTGVVRTRLCHKRTKEFMGLVSRGQNDQYRSPGSVADEGDR